MLARLCSKSFKLGFSSIWTKNFQMYKLGFWKGKGTRDHIANICWIMEKVREFLKNIYFCFIDYAKAFDCVDHNKLWKIVKEMGISDHLTCLLRSLYVGQEATVRTRTNWFKIKKGVWSGCVLSLCLFNLYVECVHAKSTPWTVASQAPLSLGFPR